MNTPKISIITVCKNAAGKLPSTIESVFHQTYKNIEYLIVDGGSSDNTKEVVSVNRANIAIFISEPDTGIFNAMNKGIKAATGDIIIFLNAGDFYVSKNVIQWTVEKMLLNSADLFLAKIIWEYPPTKDICVGSNESIRYAWDLKLSNFPHPATFYKKAVFERVGLFDDSYRVVGDYEWNLRALIKHKVPFQYLNIITTFFTAEGISVDPRVKQLRESEELRAREIFFAKHFFMRKNIKFKLDVERKVIGRLLNLKLNRIY